MQTVNLLTMGGNIETHRIKHLSHYIVYQTSLIKKYLKTSYLFLKSGLKSSSDG